MSQLFRERIEVMSRIPLALRGGSLLLLALVATTGCTRVSGEVVGTGTPGATVTPVTVIKPRRDPALIVTVRQPAYVEPFQQADLQARAAGPVRYLVHSIGDLVKRGDLLLELDVPDRVQDVVVKTALIGQQQAELDLSAENVHAAEAALITANDAIKVEQSTLASAEATMSFRESEFKRYKVLAERNAVTPDVVDEQQKNYRAAVATYGTAKAAVTRATSAREESKAKLAAARADVMLKRMNVVVAEKNRDFAQAQLNLARITAPFDGMLVKRTIDPGSFVRDAGSSGGAAFLSLVRTDIVTVTTRLPDNYAPVREWRYHDCHYHGRDAGQSVDDACLALRLADRWQGPDHAGRGRYV